MQVKCKYCESYISDTDERCPSCGAVNDLLVRTANGVPKTIEELKQWYIDHNLPDENTTRFFIGKDYKATIAFGIYKDEQTGNFVVYKNKDTGQRMVRYEGKDEAYAVNEFYQKLKIEIQNQKDNNKIKSHKTYNLSKENYSKLMIVHIILIFCAFPLSIINIAAYIFLFLSLNPGIFIMIPIFNKVNDSKKCKKIDFWWHLISIIIFIILLITPIATHTYKHKSDAYYVNNNLVYYRYGADWYYYSNNSWNEYDGDTSNFSYIDDDYPSEYNIEDFEDSQYYGSDSIWNFGFNINDFEGSKYYDSDSTWHSSSSSSSSDWDSSSSWDSSDSWDSSSTDWDSDW